MKKRLTKPIETRTAEAIVLDACPITDEEAERARMALAPSIKGADTIAEYTPSFGNDNLPGLISELSEQIETINCGDMAEAEGMLLVQAHALDAMFNHLAKKALRVTGIDQTDRYLRLALKAQSQCLTTLDTLANLKSPRLVSFVQQANIGNAVQVNNGIYPQRPDANVQKKL